MSAVLTEQLTYDAYLAWEAHQPGRHEFFKGQVFAMVGPQRVHGEIVRNLTVALQAHLQATPCRSAGPTART